MFVRKYPLYETEHIRDLKELTDRSIRLYKKKDAFKILTDNSESRSVTYGQFGDDLYALGSALVKLGLSGTRVALIGENSYQWVLSYFAIVNTNTTVVPLDKELDKEEILFFIKRSGAGAFIFSDAYKREASYVSECIPELLTVSFTAKGGGKKTLDELLLSGKTMVSDGQDLYSATEIDRERVCSILFTSGTTGASKGVMLTHRSIAANIVAACQNIRYTENDTLLSVLPIHHSYEDVGGIFSPIHRGCAIAFCSGIKQLPACFAAFKPTIMVLVPLYLDTFNKRIWDSVRKQGKERKLKTGILLGNALSALGVDIKDRLFHEIHEFFGGRLKLVVCGGARLAPALVKSFRDIGIKVLQGYGTTECSPIIAANRNESHKDASVGPVLKCNSVRIDEAGQILVKGDNVMAGYLDDEEATAAAFDNGWYKTGDLGFVDGDGFLYVTGRCKDLIVLQNGKNVMPEEIEELLCKSPIIAEAMVKEAPGDILMSIVYPDPEATKGMDKDELRKAVQDEIDKTNEKLIYYKKIRKFELRDKEFPKTSTKKIIRYKVAEESVTDV